jgi:hypothetical protein
MYSTETAVITGHQIDLRLSTTNTQQRSWLTHCAKSRKVASSIPNGVFEIFHRLNPSGSTRALRSTQPLIEMSPCDMPCEAKAAGA